MTRLTVSTLVVAENEVQTSRDEKLAAEFEVLEPRTERGSTEPSETRAYLRDNFDTIAAARQRGLTWPQITDVLTARGVRAPDKSLLKWRVLKSLFHAERYTMGGKRKRRTKKPAAQPQTPAPAIIAQSPREIVTFDPNDGAPPDRPKPKFSFAKPR